MVMSDKEIVQRFRKMDGKDSARVQILAELNGCEKKYIEAALADAGIKIKKPGRKKQEPPKKEQILSRSQERRQQEQKPKKQVRKKQEQSAAGVYTAVVVSAVKIRMRDLEQRVEEWNEQIDTAMEEWAKLKEWYTAYGNQPGTNTI